MIVLGIDPSYKRTGFAIVEDGKLLYGISANLKDYKTKKEKRKRIKDAIKVIENRYYPDKIVVERTRLYSRGFISLKTIIALGSLISTIVDATDLDVYSVDSRAFKSKVIGKANSTKEEVMNWVKIKFNIETNEDEADAIAIALYSFMANPLLKKESD